MNNIHTFIPAPAGHQLALWHFANGESLRPLIGWMMQAHGVGEPIILEGVRVRVPHPDEATYTQLVTAETVPSFDLDTWATLAASTFESAVGNHTAGLEAGMATDGYALVSGDHARYEAASRIVSAGRAQWDGRNYDRITPC